MLRRAIFCAFVKEVFSMDMTPVLTQMGILVFIMAVGFLCTKLGVTGSEFTRSASKIVMNVLLVFTIFSSVASAQIDLSLADVGIDVLAFFVMVFISALVGWVLPRLIGIKGEHRGIAAFALCFTNTAFVGFPVANSIFGAEGMLIATISNVPFNLLVYTMGLAMISGSMKSMNAKSAISAPLVSTVIAVAWFLTGWELPAPVVQCFDIIGSATVPMSMLVVGASLGGMSAKAALGDWRVYVLSLVRLIAIPVLTWLIFKPFVHDELLLGVTVILSACPSAMLATVLAIQSGRDETYASQCVFVSTVLSAATIPLVVWLLL